MTARQAPRTLVICGDDLGLHPAINAGVFRSHEEGPMRAASLVVTGGAVDEALRYAAAHDDLDVGVHLALLDVEPAGDPSAWQGLLDHRGLFPPSASAVGVARVAGWVSRNPDVAVAEFDAQLRRAAALGIQPTHVDGHNHLHLLPALARRVFGLCVEHGIGWIRVPRAPVRRLLGRRWSADRGGIKGTLVRLAGRAAARQLGAAPVRTADHLVGLGLVGERVTVRQALQLPGWLEEGVTEWMAHPAESSRPLEAAFPWGAGWGRELEVLCDPRLVDEIGSHGVRVTGFRDV